MAGIALPIDGVSPELLWAFGAISVCMVVGLTILLAMYYSPVSVKHGDHIGGGWFHPRVELGQGERIDMRFRAAIAHENGERQMGMLALTPLRAIFLPSRFPWEEQFATTIEYERVRSVDRDRLPPAAELGVLRDLFRVQGLRVRTENSSFWFGKPNLKRIEEAIRMRAGP